MKKTFISFLLLISYYSYAQVASCACCSENHTSFDFWVGTWSVTDSTGTIVGTNHIEKLQNECVLRENWIGTSGTTGMSTNFFNLKTKQWEQLWVDNSGKHLKLKGNKIGNQMIMISEVFRNTDGKYCVNRITWTHNSDETVRQLWEVLSNGVVLNVAFNGLYTKVE